MKKINNNKVSLIGLGKLGLPLASCLADGGTEIVGIDNNPKVINKLKSGEMPFYEKDLEELFLKNKEKLSFSDSYEKCLLETDITIVLVNTQVNDTYSSLNVEKVFHSVSESYKNIEKDYHIFVLSSTVLPGDINNKIIPLIERISGKKYKKDFGFVYIPDFVKLGTVIEDFQKPEFIVIGNNEEKFIQEIEQLYTSFIKVDTKVNFLTLEEAEVAKMSFNAYYVCKLSFLNFLSNLCSRIDNVNVDNITNTIGPDKRINSGTAFFKGGIAFGGTCLPRDINAFKQFSENFGLEAIHILAAEKINNFQNKNIVDIINNLKDKHNIKKVGIVGLSFKPGTPVIIESASLKIIDELMKSGYQINTFDPLEDAVDRTKDIYEDWITYYYSHENCVKNSDCIIYTHFGTSYDELQSIVSHNQVVIDCWRVFDDLPCKHIKLGVGKNE
jgi:UDPglucose 6-dehydrogenase